MINTRRSGSPNGAKQFRGRRDVAIVRRHPTPHRLQHEKPSSHHLPDVAHKLYGYIHGIVAKSGILLAAGGVADHVHLLVTLGRETSVSELVRLVKCNSSGWIHKTFPTHQDFGWQSGYGAFSVSKSHRGIVKKYIETQVEHHKTLSFQDEFRELLRRHELEWGEQYVWD